MARWSYFYLIRIEFLGFRYHGWQKQPNYRSIQGMIDKTFTFIFQHNEFKHWVAVEQMLKYQQITLLLSYLHYRYAIQKSYFPF